MLHSQLAVAYYCVFVRHLHHRRFSLYSFYFAAFTPDDNDVLERLQSIYLFLISTRFAQHEHSSIAAGSHYEATWLMLSVTGDKAWEALDDSFLYG